MDDRDFDPKVKVTDFNEANKVGYLDIQRKKWYYAKTVADYYYFGQIDTYDVNPENIKKLSKVKFNATYIIIGGAWDEMENELEFDDMPTNTKYPMIEFFEIWTEDKPKKLAVPISANTKYIKSGSFGATFRPAFPNKNANGEWKTYNNDVVKLFFNKDERNAAKEKTEELYSYTSNEGHKSYLYQFDFKKKNIPNDLLEQIPERKRNLLKNTLYPLRMPNLGVDMEDIIESEYYRPIRQIPISTLLEQMVKVITQVKTFVQKDRIHSDIRETNMMINAKTGAITIIDFDFFQQSTTFYREEDIAFYNRPPENYLYCVALTGNVAAGGVLIDSVRGAALIKDARTDEEEYMYQIKKIDNALRAEAKASGERKYDLGLYMANNNDLIFRRELGLEITDRDALLKIIRKNCELIFKGKAVGSFISNENNQTFEDAMLPYFDAFGLALSLLNLLVVTYTKFAFSPKYTMETAVKNMFLSGRFSKAKKVVAAAGAAGNVAGAVSYEAYSMEELEGIYKIMQCVFYMVLAPMISLDITKRINIDDATERINSILTAFGSKGELDTLFGTLTNDYRNKILNAVAGKTIAAAGAGAAGVGGGSLKKSSKAKTKSAKKRKQKRTKTYKKKSSK